MLEVVAEYVKHRFCLQGNTVKKTKDGLQKWVNKDCFQLRGKQRLLSAILKNSLLFKLTAVTD